MAKKSVIFHVSVVVVNLWATYYSAYFLNIPNTEQYKGWHAAGGMSKYLTLWNMIIQSVFFWICLLNDFFGTNEINPKSKSAIRQFKDILFCSIAFPLSAFVAITFWGLYAVDRELVLPKILDNYFPTWLNHIMHTNILIFTLIELVSSFRVYPTRKQGLSILTGLMLVYLIWVLIIFAKSDHWVYPVLEVLNWPQRFCFFIALLFVAHGFYFMGEILNKVVWGEELNSVAGASARKMDKKRSN